MAKVEHINVKEEHLEREDSGFYDAKEKDSEENSSKHRQDSDLKDEAKDECRYFNPLCANRNKSRLLFSSAKMIKKPLWQAVWTQIRLLL